MEYTVYYIRYLITLKRSLKVLQLQISIKNYMMIYEFRFLFHFTLHLISFAFEQRKITFVVFISASILAFPLSFESFLIIKKDISRKTSSKILRKIIFTTSTTVILIYMHYLICIILISLVTPKWQFLNQTAILALATLFLTLIEVVVFLGWIDHGHESDDGSFQGAYGWTMSPIHLVIMVFSLWEWYDTWNGWIKDIDMVAYKLYYINYIIHKWCHVQIH